MHEIRTNKSIKLVTLGIGGNDLALLQARCWEAGSGYVDCVLDNLPSALASYGSNLALILRELRERANYSGELVLVNNYSPNADPLTRGAIFMLNQTMAAVGAQFGVRIADGFGAFQDASGSSGDPCAAGLVIPLPVPPACDIHPSESGRNLLARVILGSLGW